MTADETLEEMENILRGECVCDYITKEEMMNILDFVEEWLKTAKPGDVYCYDGYSFILEANKDD